MGEHLSKRRETSRQDMWPVRAGWPSLREPLNGGAALKEVASNVIFC
jgi:hypothetical protein